MFIELQVKNKSQVIYIYTTQKYHGTIVLGAHNQNKNVLITVDAKLVAKGKTYYTFNQRVYEPVYTSVTHEIGMKTRTYFTQPTRGKHLVFQ